MEKIIEENTSLNFEELNTILLKYDGMIAGSSALFAYLPDEKWNDFDIDIYFYQPNYNTSIITKYFTDNGYEVNKTVVNYSIKIEQFNSEIHKVLYLKNKMFDTEIQIIYTLKNMIYILSTFDLSFCATHWDGKATCRLSRAARSNRRTHAWSAETADGGQGAICHK